MKNNKSGIDGEQFKLTLAKEMYGDQLGIKLQVLSDPVPYSRERKSKWKIVNWWRKWRGTYYEEGYEYTVKIVEKEPIGKPGKTNYTLADDDPEKIIVQQPKVVGKIELTEIKKNRRGR